MRAVPSRRDRTGPRASTRAHVCLSTRRESGARHPRHVDRPAALAYSLPAPWEAILSGLTIRDLDDDLAQRLKRRAEAHGRSVAEEAREILRSAGADDGPPRNLAAAIRARVAPLGGVELDLPAREPPPLGAGRGAG